MSYVLCSSHPRYLLWIKTVNKQELNINFHKGWASTLNNNDYLFLGLLIKKKKTAFLGGMWVLPISPAASLAARHGFVHEYRIFSGCISASCHFLIHGCWSSCGVGGSKLPRWLCVSHLLTLFRIHKVQAAVIFPTSLLTNWILTYMSTWYLPKTHLLKTMVTWFDFSSQVSTSVISFPSSLPPGLSLLQLASASCLHKLCPVGSVVTILPYLTWQSKNNWPNLSSF